MRLIYAFSLLLVAVFLWLAPAPATGEPISGVYFSKRVETSPRFNAKGMAWWNDRLVIVNREPAILHAFTPPDKFEVLKKEGLTNPFGATVDPDGNPSSTRSSTAACFSAAATASTATT